MIVKRHVELRCTRRHRDHCLPGAIALLRHRNICDTSPVVIAPMQRHAGRVGG